MDEPTAETVFSAHIPAKALKKSHLSLALLSQYRISAPADLQTYVTLTVERAWDTSLEALSCEQVRMLVGQKLGLKWLALPVANFVHKHAAAEIKYYPGDFTLSVLRAFEHIKKISLEAACLLRDTDYSSMLDRCAFSRLLVREAAHLVARTRQ